MIWRSSESPIHNTGLMPCVPARPSPHPIPLGTPESQGGMFRSPSCPLSEVHAPRVFVSPCSSSHDPLRHIPRIFGQNNSMGDAKDPSSKEILNSPIEALVTLVANGSME